MWDEAKKSFWEAINEWLDQVATDLAKGGLDLASDYIRNGMDLSQIPFFSYIMITVQMLSTGLFFITFYGQILQAMKEHISGEGEPNWFGIVGNAAVAAGMIWATPYIIQDYLIPISNEIVDHISKAPVEWDTSLDTIKPNALDVGATLSHVALHLLLGFLIWAVGMVALVIAQMITYGQLAVAIWVGPLLANQAQTGTFGAYWKEVIALIFTPVLRMALFVGVMSTAGKGTFDGLLWSIGFMFAAISGPSILKGYLHRSGAGSMVAGGGRFVLYNLIMSRFRRK